MIFCILQLTNTLEVCREIFNGTILLFIYIRASVVRIVRVSLAFFVAVFALLKNTLGIGD